MADPGRRRDLAEAAYMLVAAAAFATLAVLSGLDALEVAVCGVIGSVVGKFTYRLFR